jgi:sulfate adenylyltransferase subunit 1 (EFTu-like GTPase family)/uncharacterized membrane protein
VSRPDADFRGFAGLVLGDSARPGMRVRVLPGGQETTIARIVTFDGDLQQALPGQAVTLTLGDDIDVSRGDIIASPDHPPLVSDRIEARLFWMSRDPLRRGDRFVLKLGAQTVAAEIAAVHERIDLDTSLATGAAILEENDIGTITLQLDRQVAFDSYDVDRDTGGFILIDRQTCDTVAMGLVNRDSGVTDGSEAGREKPWRSLLKSISWRVTGTVDTIVLAYLFTQNLKISAAIGSTEILTKILLYYGHERLWARIPFGVGRKEAKNPRHKLRQ